MEVVVVTQVFHTPATVWMVTGVLIASMSPMLAAPTLASMELLAIISGLLLAAIVPRVSWVHSASITLMTVILILASMGELVMI